MRDPKEWLDPAIFTLEGDPNFGDLAAPYAEQLGSPILSASDYPAEPVTSDSLRSVFLRHARVLPLALDEAALTCCGGAADDVRPLRQLPAARSRPGAVPHHEPSAERRAVMERGTHTAGKIGFPAH